MGTVDQAAPRYEQIAETIRDRIQRGELAPGDAAPSQFDLTGEFGCGNATANRASALLRAWGLIETRVGARSTVSARAVRPSSPQDHTDRGVRGEPLYPPGERSIIYEASVITTDVVSPAVVQAVDLPLSDGMAGEATRIVKRARIMLRDDEPFAACTTWLNYQLLVVQPGSAEVIRRLTSTLEEDKFRPGGTTAAVAQLFGKEVTHATTRVDVVTAPRQIAAELQLDPGTRLLWMLTTRFADDWVVEVDEEFRLPGAEVLFK